MIRKLAKRPSSNLGDLWVRLPLMPIDDGVEGWCSSRRSVKPLPSICEAVSERFDSFTTHLARYANWHSDQAESLMCAGSTPARATPLETVLVVPWSNGNDTSLTKRKRGFDSLRDDSVICSIQHSGPRVRRRHPFLVRRGTEFDSRADLSIV
jgi:hypothetical protein